MKWCLSRKPKRILEGWPSKNETDICFGFPTVDLVFGQTNRWWTTSWPLNVSSWLCTTENMMKHEKWNQRSQPKHSNISPPKNLWNTLKMIPGINYQIFIGKLPPILNPRCYHCLCPSNLFKKIPSFHRYLRSHQQLCPPWRWFFPKRKMGEDLVVLRGSGYWM